MLVAGAVGVVALGAALLVVVTRRAVRRRASGRRRFVGLPAGLSAAGLLGMALATRPDRRRPLAAGGAIVATAVGIAGVLGVWSFESSRDRLVTEGRLFGADADMAWRGEPDEVDRAVEVAVEPGVEAVGVRWGLDTDLELDRSRTARPPATPSALDAVVGLGRARRSSAAGRRPGQDEVALGRHVLDELGVDIADTCRVSGPGGDAPR